MLCAVAGASLLALAAFSPPASALEELPFVKPVTEEPAVGTAADFTASRVTYDPRTKLSQPRKAAYGSSTGPMCSMPAV